MVRIFFCLKLCLGEADRIPGLHFLPPAYKGLYESLMELIVRKWPDQDPMGIPFCLPAWTEAPR